MNKHLVELNKECIKCCKLNLTCVGHSIKYDKKLECFLAGPENTVKPLDFVYRNYQGEIEDRFRTCPECNHMAYKMGECTVCKTKTAEKSSIVITEEIKNWDDFYRIMKNHPRKLESINRIIIDIKVYEKLKAYSVWKNTTSSMSYKSIIIEPYLAKSCPAVKWSSKEEQVQTSPKPTISPRSRPDYSSERPSIILTPEEANKIYNPEPGLREEKIKGAKERIIESRPRRAGKNNEYIKHWMNNLISLETIIETEFSDWIEGFQGRYNDSEIMLMRDIWWARKISVFRQVKSIKAFEH